MRFMTVLAAALVAATLSACNTEYSTDPVETNLGADTVLGNRDSGNLEVIDTAVDVSRGGVEIGNRPNPGTPEPGNDAEPETVLEQAQIDKINEPCVRRENILVVTNAGGEQAVNSIPSQYGCPVE